MVHIPSSLRSLAGGATSVPIDARNVRELIQRLDERFPGARERLGANVAVAIDGEIYSDPELEPLTPDSEVHFLPAISGG